MEGTNTSNTALSFKNTNRYKLDQVQGDLLTISPPGPSDKIKKSLRLVSHSEGTESPINSAPLPTTTTTIINTTTPPAPRLEGIKSQSLDLVDNVPTSSIKSFINTPKYIRQYLSDTFKADGFGLDATSVNYPSNMRVSRKSSKSKALKDTQDTSTNSSDPANKDCVKVMKELKFKRRRSTPLAPEKNYPDAKEKTSVSGQDVKDDDDRENGYSPDLLNPGSPDDKIARKPSGGVKRNLSTRDRTSEDSANSSASASLHSHKVPPPIETVIPEDKTFKTEIESSNSSPAPSPTTENNNKGDNLSRSSSVGSNRHSRYLTNDTETVSRKKSIVPRSKKLIKRGNMSSSDANIAVNDDSIVTGYAMANPKRNKEYHSFFKSIPQDEYLLNDYGCALQKEILAHGRIYISFRHICFHANIFGWTTNLIMPFSDILSIEKKMTAFVIPNAISITTVKSKYFFASFLSRDIAYETFVKLWHNANPNAVNRHFEYSENTFAGIHQRETTYDSGNSASGSEYVSENERSPKSSRAKKFHITRLIPRKYQSTENPKEEMNLTNLSQPSPTILFHTNEHTSRSDDFETPPAQHDESINYGSASQNVPRTSSSPSKSMQKIALASGQTQKKMETQCECSKKNQHYDKVVMDTKFTGTTEKIYNLLCTSGFIAEFISKLENNNDTVFGEWTTAENGQLVRSASFTKRLNNSIGPKNTKCYLKEECLHREFDDYVTMLLTTETPDVPSGGSFSVKTRTCIMWGGRNKVRVIVTAAVEFSKSTWLKAPIEKYAIEGQLEYYKALEIAVRKYISQNRSEFQEPEIEDEDTDSEVTTTSPTKNHKSRLHAQSQTSLYIPSSARIISRPSSRNSSQFNLSYNKNISQSNLLSSRHGQTSIEASSLIQFTVKTMLIAFTSAKLLFKSLSTMRNANVISIWALIITVLVNACIWTSLRDINVKIDKLQEGDILRYSVMAKEYGVRGRDGRIREWNGRKGGYYVYQDDGIFDADRDKFLEWLEKNVAPRK